MFSMRRGRSPRRRARGGLEHLEGLPAGTIQGEVESRCGMGQKAQRHEVYASFSVLLRILKCDSAGGLSVARPPDLRDRPGSWPVSCCRAEAALLRPSAPLRPRPSRGIRPRRDTRAGRRSSARRMAGPTPPAMAMWFSLIRIASWRPMRWLRPPPAATACFSSSRSQAWSCECRAPPPRSPPARGRSAVIVAMPDSR